MILISVVVEDAVFFFLLLCTRFSVSGLIVMLLLFSCLLLMLVVALSCGSMVSMRFKSWSLGGTGGGAEDAMEEGGDLAFDLFAAHSMLLAPLLLWLSDDKQGSMMCVLASPSVTSSSRIELSVECEDELDDTDRAEK